MDAPSRSSWWLVMAGSRVLGDVAEREVTIGGWLLGEPEDALTEDVVLDLVGAPGDRLGRHRHQDLGDDAVERCVGPGQHPVGAADEAVGVGRGARDDAGRQLAERALRAGWPAELAGGGGPLGGPPGGHG